MGDVRTEPSMEDILASIKRIIADDGPAPRGDDRPHGQEPEDAPLPALDPVLELTEPGVPPATVPAPMATPAAIPAPVTAALPETPPALRAAPPAPPGPMTVGPAAALVSEDAAFASRHALSSLSSMVLRTPGADNTLDALVRDMLRPLLKEWLDARLPDLVAALVEREIARITGAQG